MIEQSLEVPISKNIANKDKSFGIGLTLFGLGTGIATYLAQLGGHSEIHSKIAQYAMYTEAVTTLAGVGVLLSEDHAKRRAILKAVGLLGAAVTTAAFLSVPATDKMTKSYFKKEKSPEDIQTLGELIDVMAYDLKRHLSTGARHVIESYKP